jgi:hypothetical protein
LELHVLFSRRVAPFVLPLSFPSSHLSTLCSLHLPSVFVPFFPAPNMLNRQPLDCASKLAKVAPGYGGFVCGFIRQGSVLSDKRRAAV